MKRITKLSGLACQGSSDQLYGRGVIDLLNKIWLLIACGFLLTPLPLTAGTVPLPPKDANLFVQQEAMVSTLSLVGSLIGEDRFREYSRHIPEKITVVGNSH